jgi:hypothetical protein
MKTYVSRDADGTWWVWFGTKPTWYPRYGIWGCMDAPDEPGAGRTLVAPCNWERTFPNLKPGEILCVNDLPDEQ